MIHELRHVRAFLRVAQTRNFTRAAAELHVSQSALTVQIQQLEDSLGVILFDRNKRSVTLTEAGSDNLGPLQRLLEDAEAIVSHSRDFASARTGTVTIAALPTVAAETLPRVIETFARSHPAVRIVVLDVLAERVRELVLKRQADLGIAPRHGSSEDLIATPLFQDRLMLFVAPDHPLAERDSVMLKEVCRHPLIVPNRESSVRESVEEIAHRDGLTIQPRYEPNFMATALGLVRSGLGVAILPEIAAGPDASGFVRVPIGPHAAIRHIDLLQRTNRTLAPAATAFIEALVAHFAVSVRYESGSRKRANRPRRQEILGKKLTSL